MNKIKISEDGVISLPSTDLETEIFVSGKSDSVTIRQINETGEDQFVQIFSKSRLKTIVASLLSLSTKVTWLED